MHSARSPDDEIYPYEYRYYRKPATHNDVVQHNEGDLRRSQIYTYGDAGTDMLYSCKTSEQEKDIEDDVSYPEPTMPYYVVPVLYVPKRVVPNEEMQPSEIPAQPKCRQTRCYTKSNQEIDRYERYKTYYRQYYDRQANANAGTNMMDSGLAEDSSYYNAHYSGGSTSSFKEDIPADYPQTYSYTYMPKPKVNAQNIRTLRTCLPQDYEAKMKTRSPYECKSRQTTNSYYYPESKEIYYKPQQQQQYYTYPSEEPQRYNHRVSEYKSAVNQIPAVENKPTRMAGSSNKTNEAIDIVKTKETSLFKAKATEEKQRANSVPENPTKLVERGIQTLENKKITGTVSTQTDTLEKKSMIPSCRPKVLIENVYSDEDDMGLPDAKLKETRRCSLAKRPSTSYQGGDQHTTRVSSPIRRSRKF